MPWTKRQFINQAFSEIGLGAYAFDLEPEQLQSALRQLDGMMAQWYGKGIRIGYPLPESPDTSDLDTNTGVSDVANEPIYTNLATRLAPGFGKAVMAETKDSARRGYRALSAAFAQRPQMQPNPYVTPAGAGHRTYHGTNNPFLPAPTNPDMPDAGPTLTFE